MDKTFISLFSKCSALLKRLLILLCVFISAQTFGQIIIIPPPNILAPTTTTLSSTVNPSIAGQPVLITATVTSLGTLPLTGTVDFYNNTTGTDVTPGGVPIVNGKATYTTPILNANVSITATYSGDAANLASTSAAFAQTVNQPIIIINGTFYTTATALVSSANPSVAGSQPVTFTATVSSSGGPTPIGTVDFYDNTNNKDLTPGGVALSNGIAVFTTSSLPFGDLNITATYNGDANGNQPSTSNGLIQHVLLTISGLDVTVHSSSAGNTSAFGDLVTFNAIVSSGVGAPLGSVTFADNGFFLGTATIDGSGIASFKTSILTAGSHSITANYFSKTSTALIQTVNPPYPPTIITVGTGINLPHEKIIDNLGYNYISDGQPVYYFGPDAKYGQPVTFVANLSGATGYTPTGSVTFFAGDISLGTVGLDAGGNAIFTTSILSVGDNTISMYYSGDENYDAQDFINNLLSKPSPSVRVTVDPSSTTTTVSSNLNPSIASQLVTFIATVPSPFPSGNAIPPTGDVTFNIDGVDQSPVPLQTGNGGRAFFDISSLRAGSHTIKATYSGDGNYQGGSSESITQVVDAVGDAILNYLGDSQSTPVNTFFPNGLMFDIININPKLAGGAAVTFTAPSSGASGTFSNGTNSITVHTTALGSVGDANSGPFKANGIAGTYTVTASIPGLGTDNFTLTNTSIVTVPYITNSGETSVCSGTNSTLLTLNNYTGTIQWQSSTDNKTFTNITTNATDPTYTAKNLAATTWYRAVVTSGGTSATSASVAVTVSEAPTITTDVITPLYTITVNGTAPILSVLASGSNLTYQWYSNTINSNTGGTAIAGATVSSFIPDVHTVGTSYYYVSVGGSCGSVKSSAATVIVNPAATPVAGIITGGGGTVCSGTNTTFLILNGYTGTIQWQSSPDNATFTDITRATNPFYTATNLTASSWYRTVVSSGSTSVTSRSVEVTVTPNASAGTVTAGTSPQCIGSTTTYTVSGAVLAGGAGAWSSSNTAVATVDASTGVVTAVSAGTANIAYTVTGGCKGTPTASASYTVTPNASAGTVTAGTSPQCIGSSTTYTVSGAVLSGGTVGFWSSSNTLVATVDAAIGVVTAVSAGTTDIVYTVTGGCNGTPAALQLYTVTPNASAGTVTAGTSPQCIGSSTTYTVSGAVLGGGAGAWSSSNTTVATVDASTGVVTAVTAGTANIVYTVTGGCGGIVTSQQSYTVTPNASAGTVTAGTSPQCIGSTTTYTVSGAVLAGGVGAWSSDNTLVATVDASTGLVTAIGAGSANIVYTVTGSCGVPVSASQPYTVAPNAFAGTVNTVIRPQCIGSNTLYSVSYAVLGGGTGAWSSSDTSIARVATVDASTAFVTAVGAGTTNIVYTVTGGCGGIVTSQQSYVVNPATIITTSPVNVSTPVLDNTSFTVAASGAGTLSYQWQVSTDAGNSFTNLADNTVYSGTSGTVLNLPNVVNSMNGYEYQCVVKGSCGDATSTPATLTVTKRPTVITYTGDDNEQYSDQQTFTATLIDQETLSALTSQPVSFTLGTQSVATTTNGTGTATAILNMYQDAGASNVVSSFAGNDIYAASSDTDPFTIKKENAITDYTGPEFISVPCATCATTPVLLSASVIDTSALYPANDEYPGDIRKARVKFVNLDNGQDISGWLTPGLVNGADTTSGIVSYAWTVNLPTTGYDTYTIGVVVDGDYIGTSQSVLSVSRSSLTQFITGGGHLVPASSGGQYASDAGRKVNFGFNVKYNKTGKNLQGNMNIIFRRAGHVYQIKATSMTSLSINTANPCSQKATFVSKANLIDITDENNPVSVYGGITLQTTLTDNGEPGTNDLIGITLLSGNTLIYSSNWVSKKTMEMLLNAGNLVVNSGVVCSKTIAIRNEAVMMTEQTVVPSAISVNAYPNPLRDQTSIVYTLPATMHVNLAVYDLLGKKIADLQDASQSAGIYKVKFNAANNAAGVYIYTLSALDANGKLTVINGKLIIGR
jgi:tagatose-1,6-bisphosphate aldolase non-catalytic subunit AgaZ/GatZ